MLHSIDSNCNRLEERSANGPWPDHNWTGWWGDTPPFRTPVFVLTHHWRPSITLADTTFHFLNATAADAAEQAKAGAGGLDVRIGGGVRLWDDPSEFDDRFHHETIPSPSGVTRHLLWRRDSSNRIEGVST